MRSLLPKRPTIVQAATFSLCIFLLAQPSPAENLPFYSIGVVENAFSFATDLALGDIDQDGDLDVVAVAEFANEVAWWENEGAGAWTKHSIQTTAGTPTRVALGDFTGDGNLDVAVALVGADAVGLFINFSNGSLWSAGFLPNLDGCTDVDLADIDGDGDLDVVYAANLDEEVSWYNNVGGNGTSWTAGNVLPFDDALAVFPVDIDQDGDIDLATISSGLGGVRWYENTNNVGSQWTSHTVASSFDDGWDIGAGDMDGDGDIDLVATSDQEDLLVWFENTPSGTWLQHSIDDTVDSPRGLLVIDLDLDGDLDVAGAAEFDDELFWWENTSADASTWVRRGMISSIDGPLAVAAGDLDQDGDLDLVGVAVNDGGKIVQFLNNRLHEEISFPTNTQVSPYLLTTKLDLGDINGDGIPDWVGVANDLSNDELFWWSGPGSATPFTSTVIPTSFTLVDHQVADLDDDGDLDIAAVTGSTGRIYWYENSSDGTNWTEHSLASFVGSPRSIDIADIDGDGRPDLITAAETTNLVSWWQNLGAGFGFLEYQFGTGFDDASIVRAADLDGDGDLDIVAGSTDSTEGLRWWQQASNGSFSGTTIATRSTWRLELGDMDNDGDMDLVAGYLGSGPLVWYENDGSSSPGWTERTVASSHPTYGISLADFDRDGNLDIATTNADDDEVHVFRNRPGEAWQQNTVESGHDGPINILAGDFDQDGRADLVYGTSGSLRWQRNAGGQSRIKATEPSNRSTIITRGENAWLYSINYSHLGVTEDDPQRMTQLQLRFEDDQGVAIDPIVLADTVNRVSIYQDDGDGVFNASDSLLTMINPLLQPDTDLEVNLAGSPTLSLDPGEEALLHVIGEITGFSPALSFSVRHLADGSFAQDPRQAIRLATQAPTDLLTGTFDVVPPPPPPPLFSDGFESGNTQMWSTTSP